MTSFNNISSFGDMSGYFLFERTNVREYLIKVYKIKTMNILTTLKRIMMVFSMSVPPPQPLPRSKTIQQRIGAWGEAITAMCLEKAFDGLQIANTGRSYIPDLRPILTGQVMGEI